MLTGTTLVQISSRTQAEEEAFVNVIPCPASLPAALNQLKSLHGNCAQYASVTASTAQFLRDFLGNYQTQQNTVAYIFCAVHNLLKFRDKNDQLVLFDLSYHLVNKKNEVNFGECTVLAKQTGSGVLTNINCFDSQNPDHQEAFQEVFRIRAEYNFMRLSRA